MTTAPLPPTPAPARRAATALLLLAVAGGAVGLGSGPARAGGSDDDREQHGDLQTAKAASARFHDVEVAKAEGYQPTTHCEQGPTGAMGFHYANFAHFGSTDPTRPAVLLYAPDGKGGVRLAGVEWVVVDDDQKLKTDADRPSMFGGQPFDGPMEGHGGDMPVHYDLHVWLWEKNPSGTFAQWNPAFSC